MAFLVIAAEGQVGDDARAVFQSVIAEACHYVQNYDSKSIFAEDQLEALLADMAEQLNEDGFEKRSRLVSPCLVHADHQREALFIAALIAHLLGAITARRRQVLEHFARAFELDSAAVDQAIREVEQSLTRD